jgi:KDO2-lipid IV(A) lauroyltransferase
MIILNYLLYYLFIIPVSLLPFGALYGVSDFLYVVLYKLVGYRTNVVRINLINSFPEKSQEELGKIESLFYHHLCDVIVESFKSFTISNTEILKRMVVLNPELPEKYFAEGKSLLLAGGHYNNWEWIATSLNQQIQHTAAALYTPLSNKFFERKMQKTRSKFGLRMIPIKNAAAFFEENKDQRTATVFGIDQSPRHPNRCHWMEFLHQETGVMYGVEKYAKELDYPVLFASIVKVKRGYYTVRFSLLTDQPRNEPEGSIIEKATQQLEQQIISLPQYWLWTHKRWKHKKIKN